MLNHQTTRLFSGYNQQTSLPIFTNLSEEERKEGFLSAEFSPEQVSRSAEDLAGQFDVGVAFVSRSNPHSLDAHTAGLGMTEVGDFELMGNVYVILAFRLPAQSSS